MNDPVFKDAFYWLFMNHDLNYFLFGSITALTIIIAFFHTIRKWGD